MPIAQSGRHFLWSDRCTFRLWITVRGTPDDESDSLSDSLPLIRPARWLLYAAVLWEPGTPIRLSPADNSTTRQSGL